MNRGVWILAAWPVMRHGAQAPYAVHDRIMALRRALADEKRIALWLSVDEAVRQWVRPSPAESDRLH
jgi:hypothetical protein